MRFWVLICYHPLDRSPHLGFFGYDIEVRGYDSAKVKSIDFRNLSKRKDLTESENQIKIWQNSRLQRLIVKFI